MNRGPFPIHIGFVPNKIAWDKFMKTAGRDDPYDCIAGQCNYFPNEKGGSSVILICINNYEKRFSKLTIQGYIAHEVVHAFDHLCEYIGEKSPSKEFKAYTIQGWFLEACQAYDELVGFNE